MQAINTILSQKKNSILYGLPQTGISYFLKNHASVDLYLDFADGDVYRKFVLNPHFLTSLLADTITTVVLDHFIDIDPMVEVIRKVISKNQKIHFVIVTQKHEIKKLKSLDFDLCFILPESSQSQDLRSGFTLSYYTYGHLNGVLYNPSPILKLNDISGELVKRCSLKNKTMTLLLLNLLAADQERIVNFEKWSDELKLPSRTLREYYLRLIDEGYIYEISDAGTTKRKKFYFLDIGLKNAYKNVLDVEDYDVNIEQNFEDLIFLELLKYSFIYKKTNISFLSNYKNQYLHFILSSKVSICVKPTNFVHESFAHFQNKTHIKNNFDVSYFISFDENQFQADSVRFINYDTFLNLLWSHKLI